MQVDYCQDSLDTIDAYDTYEESYEPVAMPQVPQSMLGTWFVSAIAFLAGTVMLMVVDGNMGPALVGSLFFGAGLLCHVLPGMNNRYARRAFVLSFCICVFFTGLNQTYSQMSFGTPTIHVDAVRLYGFCRDGPTTHYLRETLPITIWQGLYGTFKNGTSPAGPWLGIMVNCLLVGLSGSLTVATGRYVFGDDDIRLRRLGTLFASSGMFCLYGSILLRDSFALYLNVLVLWAIVRCLSLPSLKKLIIASIVLLFVFYTMEFIRNGLRPMFVLFALIAVFSWTRKIRSSVFMLFLPVIVMLIGLMLLPLITSSTGAIGSAVFERSADYGTGTVAEGSLGSALVSSQPIPIKLLVGPFYILITPIPLWINFRFGLMAYHWLKGWYGLYLVWIVPMAIVGLIDFFKRSLKGGHGAPVSCFLASYVVITLLAISATSLENRHHAQFMPAMLILATFPNKHDPTTIGSLGMIKTSWFSFVILGHFAWIALKYF